MTDHYANLGSASDWSCHEGNLFQSIRFSVGEVISQEHNYDR